MWPNLHRFHLFQSEAFVGVSLLVAEGNAPAPDAATGRLFVALGQLLLSMRSESARLFGPTTRKQSLNQKCQNL